MHFKLELLNYFDITEVFNYIANSFPLFPETGENVTIRSCAVDAGTLTADTEIVRLSHCGSLIIDERFFSVKLFLLIVLEIIISFSDISMDVLKYVMMLMDVTKLKQFQHKLQPCFF